MIKMANTLIPSRLEAQIEKLNQKKAKITMAEKALREKFDKCCSDRLIREVFENIKSNGKPDQVKKLEVLEQKYENCEFGIDEILALNSLYITVGMSISNKENEDE